MTLATKLNGVVVNADSMQVYRDLRVITARPTVEEEAQCSHVMFGHVDAAVNYSVARWLDDVRQTVVELEADGRLPIIVGGTGLYFRALLEGLSDIPAVPDVLRAELRGWAEGRLPAEIHDRLAAIDPATAATLKPGDSQRNLRALEVFMATSKSMIDLRAARSGQVFGAAECRAFFLAPDRDVLRQRIDARFDLMLAGGALDEVRALMERGLDPALPAMRAHGVPALMRHLRGEISLAEAAAIGKADTRHYAKRQHTWFRHQAPSFMWVRPEQAEELLVASGRGPSCWQVSDAFWSRLKSRSKRKFYP
ncbi:MAG: tRNA (adenosine(37)-N6)-dimethylallyltransferase MiaA [Hyphomicrobiales bacterium]